MRKKHESHSREWKDEPLSTHTIRAALRTRLIGQTIYYWPAVNSTNDELNRLADEGAPEGTLAITDEQLTGRGRLERKWIAPARSSLLMSLLFRPTFLAPTQVQQLTMICSLAAADAVEMVTGLRPALKWPNDLLLEGRKLAGILTELGFAPGDPDPGRAAGSPGEQAGRLDWVIVGIGLNVNVDFASHEFHRDWPELAETATSLSMVLAQPVSRLSLLHNYLAGVESRYETLRAGLSPHPEWAARLVTLGQDVVVRTPEGVHQGVAEAVDETGALLLRQPDGEVRRVLAGDVTLSG
jgi:BirA family biotin operon repressor/biotin-[acetyl-CoA-carboxylase] ligase